MRPLQPRSLCPRSLLPGLLLALAAGAAPGYAQSAGAPEGAPLPAPPEPSGVSARSFGLSGPAPDGRLVGGGPDFQAEFAPGAFLFLPALGREAPETRPASFTLEEIRVGERLVHRAAGGVPPVRDGNRAVYQRGASIEECYEVRADGVHQSFVFASPEELAGGGDLVVRGRLETALEQTAAGAPEEGLRFEVPGFGGLRWGGVTGVDAAGRTARGGIRLAGDVLELSLPATFVATATFPLTLDPLIGTTIGVQTDANHDEYPRAAYDRDEEMFLVVWQRWFSGNQLAVRGQRVERHGDLVGGLILVSGSMGTSGTIARNPAIAAVRSSGRFLVVYERTFSIWYPLQLMATAVDADDGAVSAEVAVAPSLKNQLFPAVGGERTLSDDEGVVVWVEEDAGLQMRQVTLPPSGAPSTLGAVVELEADTPLYEHTVPAISSCAGDSGYFLVTWERMDSAEHFEIEARIVTRNAAPVGSKVLVSTGDAALQNYSHSVDGDGERWVVAWERSELLAPSTDILGRAFERKGTELFPAWNLAYIEADANDREFRPEVAFTGDSMLVAYADENGDTDALYAKVVDPFTAADSGELLFLYSTTDELWSVDAASQWSGGDVTGSADDALILFQSTDMGDTPFVNDDDGNIFAQVFDADPAPVDLGGAGPGGGENFNPCAAAGNANFRGQLWGAEPLSAAFFVASPATSTIGCGGPTWLPALSPAVIILRITDGYGDAQAQLPIPANVSGLTFVTQWATLTPSGSCPLLGGFAPSNALETYVAP